MELEECKLRHLLYVRTNRTAEGIVVHVKLQQIGEVVHVGGNRTSECIEVHIKLKKVAQVTQFGWDRATRQSLFHVKETKLGQLLELSGDSTTQIIFLCKAKDAIKMKKEDIQLKLETIKLEYIQSAQTLLLHRHRFLTKKRTELNALHVATDGITRNATPLTLGDGS